MGGEPGAQTGEEIFMCKISVIIPMYNAESYIRQCIRSVIGQTYRNLEILVIDDGSTDGSPGICRQFSLADSRVRLYRQENGGVSRARNYGLDIASGEYIFFLDSDDAIHPLLLEEMMGQVQTQRARMVFCDCARMDSLLLEDTMDSVSAEDERPGWLTAEGAGAEEWFHITYTKELSGICGLISRACIGKLRFEEGLAIGEDTLFMYRMFRKQLRTAYSPCAWYYYRMDPESASHVANRCLHGQCFVCHMMIRDSEYQEGDYRFALRWEERLIARIRQQYANCRKQRDEKGCEELREIAAGERKSPLYRSLGFSRRFLLGCCFVCYPVSVLLDRMDIRLWKWKEAIRNGRK